MPAVGVVAGDSGVPREGDGQAISTSDRSVDARIVPGSLTVVEEQSDYTVGDIVRATVEVENTGTREFSFFVGFSARGPGGTVHDNQGTTGQIVTLDEGERRTVTVTWTVPSSADPGEYDLISAVWTDYPQQGMSPLDRTQLVEDAIAISTADEDALSEPLERAVEFYADDADQSVGVLPPVSYDGNEYRVAVYLGDDAGSWEGAKRSTAVNFAFDDGQNGWEQLDVQRVLVFERIGDGYQVTTDPEAVYNVTASTTSGTTPFLTDVESGDFFADPGYNDYNRPTDEVLQDLDDLLSSYVFTQQRIEQSWMQTEEEKYLLAVRGIASSGSVSILSDSTVDTLSNAETATGAKEAANTIIEASEPGTDEAAVLERFLENVEAFDNEEKIAKYGDGAGTIIEVLVYFAEYEVYAGDRIEDMDRLLEIDDRRSDVQLDPALRGAMETVIGEHEDMNQKMVNRFAEFVRDKTREGAIDLASDGAVFVSKKFGASLAAKFGMSKAVTTAAIKSAAAQIGAGLVVSNYLYNMDGMYEAGIRAKYSHKAVEEFDAFADTLRIEGHGQGLAYERIADYRAADALQVRATGEFWNANSQMLNASWVADAKDLVMDTFGLQQGNSIAETRKRQNERGDSLHQTATNLYRPESLNRVVSGIPDEDTPAGLQAPAVVAVDQSGSASFEVENTGTAPLFISSVVAPRDGVSVAADTMALGTGESTSVTVEADGGSVDGASVFTRGNTPESPAETVLVTEEETFTITAVDGSAGGHQNPTPVTATVEIERGDEPYDRSLDGDQFDVVVGTEVLDGTPSVTQKQPGTYELQFTPPAQSSPGEYDLEIEFADAAADSKEDAIIYGEGGTAQIAAAIQLDRSGSMDEIMNEAIEGGVTFVQQATDQDHVSVVSYSSGSRVDHDLARLGDNRQGVIDAIEGLTADGSTNVGGAMQDGLGTLENAPDGAITAGILMTDGKVNTGPTGQYEDDDGYQDRDRTPPYRAEEKYILNEVVPQYNEAGVCLYTIGFTRDADELFMQDVAEESDCGGYEFAGEQGEVESIQNTLAAVFRDIQGDVSDADTMQRDTGTVDAGETRTEQFGVDDTVTRTTANIQVEGADFSGLSAGDTDSPIQTSDVSLSGTGAVALVRPDGTTVDGRSSNVDVSIVGNSVIYRIEDPAPGQWSYQIQNTESDPAEYTVDVTGGAQATMELSTAGDQYYAGAETDITATLVGPTGSISGASVEAIITRPDGTTTRHPLEEQRDGVYVGAVDIGETGAYTATVQAEKGVLSRIDEVSWSVDQTPPVTITQASTPTVLQGESETLDLVVDPAVNVATTDGGDRRVGSATVSIQDETVAETSTSTSNGAYFEVSNLDPEEGAFKRGDTIDPTATIENTGDQPGEQLVEYRIGGEIFADGSIQIDPDQPPGRIGVRETLIVDVPPGEYTHGFYTEDDAVTGTLVVYDRLLLSTSDFAGVGHDGTIPGSEVTLDSQAIAGTSTETVAAMVSVPEDTPPGDYSGTIKAFRSDGSVVTEEVTLTVSQPSTFELDVVGTDSPGSADGDLTVTVEIHNTGDVAATQTVELVVPGLGRDAATVSLDGGQTTVATFAVSTDGRTAGQYGVTVTSDDDRATTTVVVDDEDGTPSVEDYADDDGVVRASGLNQAVRDYLADNLPGDVLNAVIEAYLLGEPVT